MDKIPYREGEPPPGEGYILARVVDEESGADEGLWWVPTGELKQGPIRQEQVDELLPMIRWTWRHLKNHIKWCRSLEDWELGFMRDANPATEVALWVRAAYALLEFTHQRGIVNNEWVFVAICQIMNGRPDVVKPAKVTRQLQKLMGKLPEVLANPANYGPDGHLKTGDEHLR